MVVTLCGSRTVACGFLTFSARKVFEKFSKKVFARSDAVDRRDSRSPVGLLAQVRRLG